MSDLPPRNAVLKLLKKQHTKLKKGTYWYMALVDAKGTHWGTKWQFGKRTKELERLRVVSIKGNHGIMKDDLGRRIEFDMAGPYYCNAVYKAKEKYPSLEYTYFRWYRIFKKAPKPSKTDRIKYDCRLDGHCEGCVYGWKHRREITRWSDKYSTVCCECKQPFDRRLKGSIDLSGHT